METYPPTPSPRPSGPPSARRPDWIYARLDDPLILRLERVATRLVSTSGDTCMRDELGEIRHGLGARLAWHERRARNLQTDTAFIERRDGQLVLARQSRSSGIGRRALFACIAIAVMYSVGLLVFGTVGGALLASVGLLVLPHLVATHAPPKYRYSRDCPHCSYDLVGCPPGLEMDENSGLDIGPRACPECGCPWPLIPPRTPEPPGLP